MNPRTVLPFLLIAGGLGMVIWVAVGFFGFELWIRGGGKDRTLALSRGELLVSWHPVPETWFDYRFSAFFYEDDDSPTAIQAVFGEVFYPTFELDKQGGSGGFSIPFWTVALLWSVFFLRKSHSRSRPSNFSRAETPIAPASVASLDNSSFLSKPNPQLP